MRKFLAFALLTMIVGTSIGAPATVTLPAKESTPAAAPAATGPQLTPADVETFFDGFIPSRLRTEDIAGMTISVVKDGQIIFAKGYGYSDVEKKKPVVADQTMFRPGSVSKLFTWTAVMQQVEQGKIDLNKDVNEYLDFKIPEAFGKPITMTHILTHTAGFEEAIKDLIAKGDTNPDLGQYLRTHMPKRIYAPGSTPAYSNYATALAGYIVERVSGKPFSDYVAENIFKPLGMNSSTFVQPLPEALTPQMSGGYALGSDPAKPYEVIYAFPAGSLASTSTDMAKFMIAHLQNGAYGDQRILKEETAKLMHSRIFGLDPDLNGMAHGFYEESRNGIRIIGHGGDTQFFHSDLHLLLEKNVGIFLSYNSAGRNQSNLRDILFDAFMDRYYPANVVERPLSETAKADVQAVVGSYMPSRRADSSIFKTIFLLSQVEVSAKDETNIQVSMMKDPNGKTIIWRPIGNMTFQEVGGATTLAFRPDQDGRLRIVMNVAPMTFTKVGPLESSKMIQIFVGTALAVMILTLILWPIGWFLRRHYARPLEIDADAKRRRLLIRIVFALNVAFFVGLVFSVINATSNLGGLNDTLMTVIWGLQVVGILATVGHLVVFYNAFKAWTSSAVGIWGKIQATVFVLASLGLIWVIYLGNMLVFRSTF